MLRVVPRRAYFLFEDHPAISVGYTFSLEVVRNARVPNGRRYAGNGWGYNIHRIKLSERAPAGANINLAWLAREGVACCFKNSLRASARGWGKPANLTLLGPFRRCAKAKNLRSKRV